MLAIFDKNKRMNKRIDKKIGRIDEFTRLKRSLQKTITTDPYLLNHSLRVAETARSICYDMELPEDIISCVICAATLHDIGKINYFLMKDRMVAAEKERTEQTLEIEHPKTGSTMVKDMVSEFKNIDAAILYHHEKYNGTGLYGKKHMEFPLESSIVAVANHFDKLMFDTDGRTKMSLEACIADIDIKASEWFDPWIVSSLISINGFSGTNTIGALRTGNFNYKFRLGVYMDNAKEYIKANPHASLLELEAFLKKQKKLSDNNSKIISCYLFGKHHKSSLPEYDTLAVNNVIREDRIDRNKLGISFSDYFNDMLPGDFVSYNKGIWVVMLLNRKYVLLGK